ncbi:hypothetical protein V4U86_08385 [Mycobacterium sp. AMU20-3851]|uniref:hypothetical protein n=1 Tax=Mycobacterium sp. AMU20-3851 TaxID=3122055 RepID=UPI003754D92B
MDRRQPCSTPLPVRRPGVSRLPKGSSLRARVPVAGFRLPMPRAQAADCRWRMRPEWADPLREHSKTLPQWQSRQQGPVALVQAAARPVVAARLVVALVPVEQVAVAREPAAELAPEVQVAVPGRPVVALVAQVVAVAVPARPVAVRVPAAEPQVVRVPAAAVQPVVVPGRPVVALVAQAQRAPRAWRAPVAPGPAVSTPRSSDR